MEVRGALQCPARVQVVADRCDTVGWADNSGQAAVQSVCAAVQIGSDGEALVQVGSRSSLALVGVAQ